MAPEEERKNIIRQIRANQVAVDVVTLSASSYEIRCYHPAQERTGQIANSDESTFVGQAFAQSTRTEYSSAAGTLQTIVRYYRDDTADSFVRGQPHSITYPGNRKTVFAYQRGTLSGTTFTAAGSGVGSGGNATRIVSIAGTAGSGNPYSSLDG